MILASRYPENTLGIDIDISRKYRMIYREIYKLYRTLYMHAQVSRSLIDLLLHFFPYVTQEVMFLQRANTKGNTSDAFSCIN